MSQQRPVTNIRKCGSKFVLMGISRTIMTHTDVQMLSIHIKITTFDWSFRIHQILYFCIVSNFGSVFPPSIVLSLLIHLSIIPSSPVPRVFSHASYYPIQFILPFVNFRNKQMNRFIEQLLCENTMTDAATQGEDTGMNKKSAFKGVYNCGRGRHVLNHNDRMS